MDDWKIFTKPASLLIGIFKDEVSLLNIFFGSRTVSIESTMEMYHCTRVGLGWVCVV